MKLQTAAPASSIVSRLLLGPQPHQLSALAAQRRLYATQHSLGGAGASGPSSKRKAVTPFNDDGHVPWAELSAGEKTARAAQQTFNFGLVIVGIIVIGGIGYSLYSDVFAPDSKVAYYNRALDRIRKHPECIELFGDSNKIIAYGEETWNKWQRHRPIASTSRKDAQGNDHLHIHFNIEGPRGKGIAYLHLVKRIGQADYEYKYFFVEAKGHQRIYLENADADRAHGSQKKSLRLFGVNWG